MIGKHYSMLEKKAVVNSNRANEMRDRKAGLYSSRVNGIKSKNLQQMGQGRVSLATQGKICYICRFTDVLEAVISKLVCIGLRVLVIM